MNADLIDALKFSVPLIGAAVAWLWNERRRRIADEYERKEQRYTSLVEAADGFYVHMSNADAGRQLKAQFLSEIKKCWLYCPDEVIRAAYLILDLAKTGANSTDEQRLKAMGEFMVAIRKDLLARRPVRKTSLVASDFRHFKIN
jgi:hypothetical protein